VVVLLTWRLMFIDFSDLKSEQHVDDSMKMNQQKCPSLGDAAAVESFSTDLDISLPGLGN